MNRKLRARCVPAAAAATLLLGVAFALGGCGSTDCSFTATCGGGTAIVDGGGDGPVIPNDCDLNKGPKDSKGCVVDTVGVFVSAKGRGGATGTMADPLPTITAGIALAVSSKRPRVYVCEGTYAEAIKIASAVSVFGGLKCDNNMWVATEGVKPKVTPTVGPAIEVKSADGVVIQDVEALGLAETGAGKSAIGALIVRSTVGLSGVILKAGPGTNGSPGSPRSNYSVDAAVGKLNVGLMGGEGGVCTCLDGTSSKGGRGADSNAGNITGGTSMPMVGTDNEGQSRGTSCDPGNPGANAVAVPAGLPLSSPGLVIETGWDVSKRAPPSPNGRPGQGGGGGGAVTNSTTPGAGGGCGGCGGAGGDSGGNGGASIGLVSFESTVTITASTILPGVGGTGGVGGDGQPGQGGGAGGEIVSCDGGTGGSGSGGGGGPGGAGGDSIAVAWKGRMMPAVDGATTLTPAKGGGFGAGGKEGAGSGEPGLPGSAGIAGQTIKVFASP